MLKRIGQFLASIAATFVAAGIGSYATVQNIPTWYEGLNKPPLLPPNEVFGPVWSVLYFLIGVALFLIWIHPKEQAKSAYVAFFTQLFLNVAWCWVFFGLHQPWIGVVVIVALLGAIVWTMREFARISKPAMWLFVPYLGWVGFATYLTVGVAAVN
ncbi:MAG: TspO/MBR family protein [Candidatus Saccharimonadales bacterium]